MQRVINLPLENKKRLAVLFSKFQYMLHVDGISVIHIIYCAKSIFTISVHYNCVNSCFCLTAGYIQLVDQLSEIGTCLTI